MACVRLESANSLASVNLLYHLSFFQEDLPERAKSRIEPREKGAPVRFLLKLVWNYGRMFLLVGVRLKGVEKGVDFFEK